MRKIPTEVKDLIKKAVDKLIQEGEEVNVVRVANILESENGIRFYNLQRLQEIIDNHLNNLVYIYLV